MAGINYVLPIDPRRYAVPTSALAVSELVDVVRVPDEYKCRALFASSCCAIAVRRGLQGFPFTAQICCDFGVPAAEGAEPQLFLDGFMLRPIDSAELMVRDGDLLQLHPRNAGQVPYIPKCVPCHACAMHWLTEFCMACISPFAGRCSSRCRCRFPAGSCTAWAR